MISIVKALKNKLRDLYTMSLFWKPHFAWLYKNRYLRMDANEPINEKSRRIFHLDRYEFAARRLRGVLAGDARILDAACGTGYGSDILKRSAAQVTGIDIEADAIEYARAKYGTDRCTFQVSNVVEMSSIAPKQFDSVVSFETIEHVDQPLLFLQNIRRVLKQNGILIISTPNKWGLTKDHKVDYDYAMLRFHLEQFFSIEDIYVQNSGSTDLWINRGQPRKLERATPASIEQAECFIAICRNNKEDA